MEPKATVAVPTPAPAPLQPNHESEREAEHSAPWMPLPSVVHEITTPEEFDRLLDVSRENNTLLVADFMAAWCRKCKYLLPRFRKIATNTPDVYFCTVNVNAVARLPRQYEITKMPTFIFFKNGERARTIIGGGEPPKVAKQLSETMNSYTAE